MEDGHGQREPGVGGCRGGLFCAWGRRFLAHGGDELISVLSGDFRELRGAVVSPEQALDVAQLLGVCIAEE